MAHLGMCLAQEQQPQAAAVPDPLHKATGLCLGSVKGSGGDRPAVMFENCTFLVFWFVLGFFFPSKNL